MWYIENKNSTTFNIFWECNQECPFCSGYPKREFDLEKDILNKIKWLKEISLQWWEPTMSPYLFDILEYARTNWTDYINLITNWLKLADYDFASKLSWKIDCFHFAFMSHKKQNADILWWSDNALILKSKWILNLIKLWEASKIRLVHIIQKDNIDNLEELPIFISKRFPWVKLIEFKYLQYFWNKNNLWKIPKYSEVEWIINRTLNICMKLWINFIINWLPLCFLDEKFHKYTASYYNVNDEIKMKEYSTIKLNKCFKCDFEKHCIWIREDYILLNWNNEFK
jgi:hypothetical protein